MRISERYSDAILFFWLSDPKLRLYYFFKPMGQVWVSHVGHRHDYNWIVVSLR